MFSAEKARNQAAESTFDPMSRWSIFDAWQFKRIEKKIKRAAARGKTEIEIRRIRELVLLKLEENGYEVTQFCGIPGTGIRAWVGIYWNK